MTFVVILAERINWTLNKIFSGFSKYKSSQASHRSTFVPVSSKKEKSADKSISMRPEAGKSQMEGTVIHLQM